MLIYFIHICWPTLVQAIHCDENRNQRVAKHLCEWPDLYAVYLRPFPTMTFTEKEKD